VITEDQFNNLMAEIAAIKDSQSKVESLVTKVADEVKPTLDLLMNNPAIKMFLGVKKGK